MKAKSVVSDLIGMMIKSEGQLWLGCQFPCIPDFRSAVHDVSYTTLSSVR